MLNFAHAGHEHVKNVDQATHHLPIIIGATALVVAALSVIYWLLTRNVEPETPDNEEK